jgi:hypothetical protein
MTKAAKPKGGASCGGCLGLIAVAGLIAFVIAVVTSGGGHTEASYSVWENGCKTEQSFTQKEVISTWGQGAISGEELKGAPAAINAECAAQHQKGREGAPASEAPAAEEDHVGSASHAGDAEFCDAHRCIGNFTTEDGTVVECADGTFSHAGGLDGACSDHGGER